MARVNNLSNFLTDVASAIKTKKGSETAIPAANFDTEILALPSQGVYQTKVITINENGQTVITPDSGYDAMDGVQVTTLVPEKQLQTKSYNFTTNQTIELSPDTGYDGFDSVVLTINVPSGGVLQTKSVTYDRNNTYVVQPDSGYDGMSTVNVTVASPYNAKMFRTKALMDADSDKQIGDYAMVYGLTTSAVEPDQGFMKMYLPPTITLPEELTTSFSVDLWIMSSGGGGGGGSPTISPTGFTFWMGNMNSAYVEYSSEDGIHYTRDIVQAETREPSYGDYFEWDSSTSILTFISSYEHIEYHLSDNTKLSICEAIFQVPAQSYDGLFRVENVDNYNNTTSISNLVFNSHNSDTPSSWTLDYNTGTIAFATITTIYNKVHAQFDTSYTTPGLVEKLSNGKYRYYLYRYKRTKSSTTYTNFGVPNLYVRRKYDSTDNTLYFGYYEYATSDWTYSNYELFVYEIDLQNNTITNVSSQYTRAGRDTTSYTSSYGYNKAFCYYTGIDFTNSEIIYGRNNNTSSVNIISYYYTNSTSSINTFSNGYIAMSYGIDTVYVPAETQFTLDNDNQLLPGKIALGADGSHTGDGSIYDNLDTDTLLSGFFNIDLPTTYDNYLIGDPGNKVRYYKKSASGTKFLIKSKFSKFRELINTYASDSKGSFEYLSMDETMYFYLDTNKNLKIVNLETEQITTITLAQPSWYAGENLRFAKDIESILYIKSSDNKLYIYDVKAKQEYSTTVTMSSLYDFRLVYADSNYIMVQSSNSSSNANKPTYVLDTSTKAIIWNANTGTSYMTWSTPSGNWYYQTQNATTLYKWNGSAFQSIRTSNLIVGPHSSTLALEDNNYLYIPCRDSNKIIKYAKSGSESYSTINIVNNTSVSNLSLEALFIDGDYVWVTNSRYDNNFYFIKCTATINSGVPTFTEVEKIELPVLMYNKYGDNEYKLNCGYGLDWSLSLYNTLVKTTDGFDHYQNATSTSNTVSPMKIGNCNLIRVNESTSSDYDYKCIPKDKRTTYNSNNYDFPLYMLGEDMGTGGPGYDTNLVLDSLDAGGAEQYLGGTPITGISNVGGFNVFNANGDSILYYVMKTVTATSNMTGFSMNNIKILDNGVIQWLPYGNNTVFDTDDYLECTITCTDAYGNTETDVIIIYNSEKENYPGPDDPGPDDPGELE